MKAYNKWNYRHYVYLSQKKADGARPYICRLIPYEHGASIELEKYSAKDTIYYKKRQAGQWQSSVMNRDVFILDGLLERCDYEIYVTNSEGLKSDVRIFHTGYVHGTAVNYLHPDDKLYEVSGNYLCSPSIVKLPSGAILISMDVYGPGTPQLLTLIYRSDDNGNTWKFVTEVMPCFWGKLFWHNNSLYMLAATREFGDLVIGRSDDEGKTWTAPVVLARGSCHKAPVTIINTNGRLYTAFEYGVGNIGGSGFISTIISIEANADLMVAENWEIAEFMDRDDWIKGTIEGNVVESPNGDILNILRYKVNEAVVLRLNQQTNAMEFVKKLNIPTAHTKFEIVRHSNGKYYMLGNLPEMRNVLALFVSDDLESWQHVQNIVNESNSDGKKVGFQYPSFVFDGDEMLIAVRTAYNNAASFHDSNYITFHREKLL